MQGQELAIPQFGDFGSSIRVLGHLQAVDDGAVGVGGVGCDFGS
jgi:hypothetical protein